MKVPFLSALALAVALAPGAAVAKDDDTDAKPAKEKKICKTEKVTGSLTRVNRICLTQREWDQLAANTREDVNRVVRGAGRTGSPDPNAGAVPPGMGGF